LNYRTVFDVSDLSRTDGIVVAIAFILVVAPLARVMMRENRGFPILAVVSVCAVFVVIGMFRQRFTLVAAEKAHRFEVVEGIVTRFQPAPYTGHEDERFCVESKCFAYSDYVVTQAFNKTSSHGGPIREGLHARISYVGSSIIKVEEAD
jgi:hypothetical protein